MGRIKESNQKGILRNFKYEVDSLERKYTMFIKHKVDKLISFEHLNFLNIDEPSYREYKETSDFKKILKISKEYKDRYRVELADNWNSYFDKKFTLDETAVLMRKLLLAFENDEGAIEKDIEKYSKDVIILDYLITAKHLLEMLADGENYDKFSRKSKIE